MNYQWHYDSLISRGQRTFIHGYRERHHIVPKCLGGSNKKENLVYLTAREHFLAHLLLVKIYPGIRELTYAAKMMTIGSKNHQRSNNRLYAWLREKFKDDISLQLKGRTMTEEQKAKMSMAKKGKSWSTAKRESMKDKTVSEETRKKLSKANKGVSKTDEHKKKNSEIMKGRKPWITGKTHSAEAKQKQSEARKLYWSKKKEASK